MRSRHKMKNFLYFFTADFSHRYVKLFFLFCDKYFTLLWFFIIWNYLMIDADKHQKCCHKLVATVEYHNLARIHYHLQNWFSKNVGFISLSIKYFCYFIPLKNISFEFIFSKKIHSAAEPETLSCSSDGCFHYSCVDHHLKVFFSQEIRATILTNRRRDVSTLKLYNSKKFDGFSILWSIHFHSTTLLKKGKKALRR